MSSIKLVLKRAPDVPANPGTLAPAVPNCRVESQVESGGSKGNFFATILISGLVLVGVIVLGSRIAQRLQSVKDGFTSSADGSAPDTPAADSKSPQPASRPPWR